MGYVGRVLFVISVRYKLNKKRIDAKSISHNHTSYSICNKNILYTTFIAFCQVTSIHIYGKFLFGAYEIHTMFHIPILLYMYISYHFTLELIVQLSKTLESKWITILRSKIF